MLTTKFRYYIFSIWNLLREFSPRSHILRVFIKIPHPRDQIIRLMRGDLRFYTRGAMDIWTIKETFVDRFYEKYGTPIQNNWTIVDIGAGIGDFSIFCSYRYPENRVYSFEPTPESFLLFKKNLEVNKISNVKPYQQAVWSSNGEISINTDHAEPGQFSSQAIEKIDNSQSFIHVPSLTIEGIFQSVSIDTIHLLKLDCEGAEYPIIFNTPDYLFSRINRVVLEYHDSIVEFNHHDLVSFLKNKGYIVSTYPNFVHSNLGYLYAFRRDIAYT